MITFKQYLNEDIVKKWTTTDLELKECIDLLNIHCKDGLKAISTGGVLFRGFDGKKQPQKYHLIDTTNSLRTSRDSDNLYQLGMDNSLQLSEFPKRSNSLICSAGPYLAGMYSPGPPMVVIPFDGTKIAVSKEGDFLRDTIVRDKFLGNDGLDAMFEYLAAALAKVKVLPDTKGQFTNYNLLEEKLSSISSAELLLHILSELSEIIDISDDIYDIVNGDEAPARRIQEFENYLKGGKGTDKNIFDVFKRLENNPNNKFAALTYSLLTPSVLGLSMIRIGEELPKASECWVSGKAILLEFKTFLAILDELKESNFPVHSRYKNLIE